MLNFLTKKKNNPQCFICCFLTKFSGLCVPQTLKDFPPGAFLLMKHYKLWDYTLIIQIFVIPWESVQNLVLRWNNTEFQILEVKWYDLSEQSKNCWTLSWMTSEYLLWYSSTKQACNGKTALQISTGKLKLSVVEFWVFFPPFFP